MTLLAIGISEALRQNAPVRSGKSVTNKPPMLKIPINPILVSLRICKAHSCGIGARRSAKSVRTFMVPMTIQNDLIWMQSA